MLTDRQTNTHTDTQSDCKKPLVGFKKKRKKNVEFGYIAGTRSHVDICFEKFQNRWVTNVA